MKTLLFIYNPTAGKAKITNALGDIIPQFQQEDWLVTLYATRAGGDATRIVQELGGQYDRIVCSGGDGTLNEVVSGIVHGGLEKPPGYLPAGSTNDFSKTLRLPANFRKAAEIAVTGAPFACDMGQFNGDRVFVYVAAFGVFTSVSYDTPSILLYLAAVSQRFYVKKSLKTSWHIFIKNHFRSLHTYLRKFFCGYLENQNERDLKSVV